MRPLQFSKYLREYGWNVSVLSVSNDLSYARDESLMKSIPEGQHVWRAYRFPVFDTIHKLAKNGLRKYPLAYSFLDAQFDWVPDAIRVGKRILSHNDFDAILATVPPYSGVRVARSLSEFSGLPTVVDLRDPFTINVINWPTPFHKKFYEIYWRTMLSDVDRAIVLADYVGNDLVKSLRLGHLKPVLIPNGYDPADFPPVSAPPSSRLLRFGYVGSLYGHMSARPLFESLRIALEERPDMRRDLEIVFMGGMNRNALLSDAKRLGVKDIVRVLGYRPHSEAVQLMSECHVLLLFTGMVYQSASGKIFEYAASGRPVLSFGVKDYTKSFIQQNGFGYSVDGSKPEEGARVILDLHRLWSSTHAIPGPSPANYERYSRQKLAGKLASLLDEMVS